MAESGASSLVDDEIAGDGEQPGPRGALHVVGDLGVTPGPQQRLLDDVLGAGLVTGEPQRVPPQRGRVLVVEHAHHRCLRIVHEHLHYEYVADARWVHLRV